MTKSELVKRLAHKLPNLYKKDVESLVNIILDCLIETLQCSGRVEIRRFGSFSTKITNSWVGYSPRKNVQILVGQKRAVVFKVSRQLMKFLNNNREVSRSLQMA